MHYTINTDVFIRKGLKKKQGVFLYLFECIKNVPGTLSTLQFLKTIIITWYRKGYLSSSYMENNKKKQGYQL